MLPNQQETADLVMFTEEILNGKLHFLCTNDTYYLVFFLSINYLKLCSVNNVLSSMGKFYHHKSNWK